MLIKCKQCGEAEEHKHMHDTAHGLDQTHMAGSERYTCERCGHSIYKSENEERKLNLPFLLD